MIIYRVAQGRAWSSDTSSVMSAARTKPQSPLRFNKSTESMQDMTDAVSERVVIPRRSDSTLGPTGSTSGTLTGREDVSQKV